MIEDQPPPIAQPDRKPVWELVIVDAARQFAGWRSCWQLVDDMTARDKIGRERYGTPLTTGNGRDHLVDAYQELLDGAVYMRAWLEENKHREGHGDGDYLRMQASYSSILHDAYALRDMISKRS
jgi:hypothetical protein